MKREVFWKNSHYKKRPSLKKNIECDYLIVGGGIAGISLAYFLSKENKNIVLIEKNFIGSGATGSAAGTLAVQGELDLKDIIKKHGSVKGNQYWEANKHGLTLIKEIIKDNKIDCDYEPLKTFYGGYSYKTHNNILEEYEAIKNSQSNSRLLVGKEIREVLNTPLFRHAIYSDDHSISVNPLKFVQNLSNLVEKKGVKIYEDTNLSHIEKNIAKTHHNTITFKKLIMATDIHDPDKEVVNIKSTIAVTKPLSQKQLELTKLNKNNMLIFDSKKNYSYLKLTEDKRILAGFGGIITNKKHKNTEPHYPHFDNIKNFMALLFPYLKLNFEYVWSGHFGVTKDFYPRIKRKDNVYHISGCGSQVVCVMASKYLSEKLLNKKSKLDSFFKL